MKSMPSGEFKHLFFNYCEVTEKLLDRGCTMKTDKGNLVA